MHRLNGPTETRISIKILYTGDQNMALLIHPKNIKSAEVIKSAELGELHKEESVLIDDRNMALPIDPKVL